MAVYICIFGKYNPDQPRVSRLAQALKKSGRDVRWVVSDADKEYSDVFAVGGGSKLSYLLKASRFLRKRVKRGDIVLGYVHIGGLAAMVSTRGKKAKFLYDYPDPWKGWEYYNSDEDNFKWKLGRFLFKVLERLLYRKADFVTAASYGQMEFLRKQHGHKKGSDVILNCPMKSVFNTRKKDAKLIKIVGERRPLIFLGNVCHNYGIDVMLEALENIIKSEDVFLIVLGRYISKNFFNKVENTVKEKGLENSIMFHPTVKHVDVPKILNVAEIGFIPFLDRFYNHVGGPNKLFEYMACGVVPIASEMREFKRYVTTGKNGILVEPENPEKLAKATIELLRNPGKVKSMRKYNLSLFDKTYNWEVQERKFLDIIDRL